MGDAAVEGGRVVLDGPLDAVAHRSGVDLAVRDVALAVAEHGRDRADREAQVGAGSDQTDAVGRHHELLERHHRLRHALVVEGADAEVEVLESGGRLLGELGHRGARPAQDAPARLRHPDLHVDRLPELRLPQLHALGRHVGVLGHVVAAAQAEVGGGARHQRRLARGLDVELLGRGGAVQLAVDQLALEQDERVGAHLGGEPDQGVGELVGDVDRLDQHALPGLEGAGVAEQDAGELLVTGVGHDPRSLTGVGYGDGHMWGPSPAATAATSSQAPRVSQAIRSVSAESSAGRNRG